MSTAAQPPSDNTAQLDQHALSRLRWRCRRGMLENDLFIERFFQRHEHEITPSQADALLLLMDLSDNDLLDLLLGRQEPGQALDSSAVRDVLRLLRAPALGQSAQYATHSPANPQGSTS